MGCSHFNTAKHQPVIAKTTTELMANVSYQAVIEQPYQPAQHRISYGTDPAQFGLLWSPLPEQGDKPLVIFIHGGCWLSEYNIEHSYALASAIANRGYPVWSIEYRRTGVTGGGWPTTYNDVVQGIAAAARLENQGIDLSKLVLVGHSAGGHLALLAGANWQTTPTLASLPTTLGGVIGLAAITDIIRYAKGTNSCETATPQFMGGSEKQIPQAYQQADPASIKHWQQTWLLHRAADSIVAPTQANLTGAETIILDDAGHFDWIHGKTVAFELLINTLDKM